MLCKTRKSWRFDTFFAMDSRKGVYCKAWQAFAFEKGDERASRESLWPLSRGLSPGPFRDGKFWYLSHEWTIQASGARNDGGLIHPVVSPSPAI